MRPQPKTIRVEVARFNCWGGCLVFFFFFFFQALLPSIRVARLV